MSSSPFKLSLEDFKEPDDSQNLPEEVKYLYRNREFDENIKKKPFNKYECIYDKYFTFNSNIVTGSMIFLPSDKNYYKMSNQEKIESGVPSSVDLFFKKPYVFMLISILMGLSADQYSKIYSPSGVILRNSIKESWIFYLKRRGPMFLMFSSYVWYRYYYNMNKIIDFSNSNEDELDLKIQDIKRRV